MTHPTRFILLCHARTGSSLFGSLLGSHPDIGYVGECFKHYRKWRGVRAVLRPVIARYPLLRLNWMAQQASQPVFGCKLAPTYVRDIRQMIRQTHARSWLIVHLTRSSTFRTALSLAVAYTTRRYNTRHEGLSVPAPQLVIAPDAFVNAIQRVLNNQRMEQAALTDIPHMSVFYESDLADPAGWEGATGRVFAALGLAPIPLHTTIRPPWSRPYAEMISNYAELLAAARASGYADLLEDAG